MTVLTYAACAGFGIFAICILMIAIARISKDHEGDIA
jgi:hypothetical protein